MAEDQGVMLVENSSDVEDGGCYRLDSVANDQDQRHPALECKTDYVDERRGIGDQDIPTLSAEQVFSWKSKFSS
jgi:hypothetical protein